MLGGKIDHALIRVGCRRIRLLCAGEEELGLDLEALARRGEVAWADADDAPRAERPPSAPPPTKGASGAHPMGAVVSLAMCGLWCRE